MITIDLGVGSVLVPYEEGLDRQRELHRSVRDGRSPATLLLLEHEAVYTAGRRTEASDHPVDGSRVVQADRGGRITWHGPGQLVGYPIVALPQPIDVVAWVRLLERVLLDIVSGLGAQPFLVDGRSGVWLTVDGAPAKVAAIGVRVAEGVTTHGFALNCSNSLDPFSKIVPCGIRDAGVTTLSHALGRRVDPVDVVVGVRERLERALAETTAEVSA